MAAIYYFHFFFSGNSENGRVVGTKSRMYDRLSANIRACARPVLDYESLAKPLG